MNILRIIGKPARTTSGCPPNINSKLYLYTHLLTGTVIMIFDVLLTVYLSIFISVINQLDAQNFCFTISLFHASTCFEQMCSSSGGQNSITQPLVEKTAVLYQPVHETATYRCDDTRGCVMQFWPPDDEHICSKHVAAWNKLIVKQKCFASSWLITEINIMLHGLFFSSLRNRFCLMMSYFNWNM